MTTPPEAVATGKARPTAAGSVRRNVMAKVVVLGVSGLLSVVTTRMMIGNFGVAAYAEFGLLATMTALLPFADLGVAAAVVNRIAASNDPADDPQVRGTLVSAIRLLLVSGTVIAGIGVVISVLGLWPTLLGRGLLPGGEVTALLCLLVFAAALPLGLGQRMLNGLGRSHFYVLVQGLAAPAMLGGVALLVLVHGNGTQLALISYLASALVGGVAVVMGGRALSPQLGRAIRDVPRLRTAKTAPVLGMAWPMLIQMLALPVAMQTDRLLLSHLGTVGDLAQYNLGSQLFGLVLQTISSAGLALWPVFARARAVGEIQSPVRISAWFGLGALGVCAALGLAMPLLLPIVTGGRITLDGWVVVGFVVFVAAQAAKYPLGMYMTDAPGLKFQVPPILVLVPLNLTISWALIGVIGAGGPVVGSAIAVTLCQTLPNLWYVRRDLARRAAAQNDEREMT